MTHHRLGLLPLLTLACTSGGEALTTPECTFAGTFDGAVQGALDISVPGCQGTSSGGFTGGSLISDDWWVDVLLEDGLILDDGATLEGVDAIVQVTDRTQDRVWAATAATPCSADVDEVASFEAVAGPPERFVAGTVECSGALSPQGSNPSTEDVQLIGTATFRYRLY